MSSQQRPNEPTALSLPGNFIYLTRDGYMRSYNLDDLAATRVEHRPLGQCGLSRIAVTYYALSAPGERAMPNRRRA